MTKRLPHIFQRFSPVSRLIPHSLVTVGIVQDFSFLIILLLCVSH